MKRVFIYGAGQAGVMLLRELKSNASSDSVLCGFIDDAPDKKGIYIHGVPVLGDGADLSRLRHELDIHEVIIAIPSAKGAEMTAILQRCHDAGIRFRTMPSLAEIIEDRRLTSQLRAVAVEDLLGRQPVVLEEERIRGALAENVVMVTGAGGSIGAELCRQLARFGARTIVGFDIAESPLFHLDHEMKDRFPAVSFQPELGSIQNRTRLAEVFGQHRPKIVYHAAAYKHVPLSEANLFEAVENNILGTYRLALAAKESGAAEFVMISSDKAVRPANIMGATKRVAELIVRSLQNGSTKFVSVRFGNVLDSNGSVVPLFRKQIASGGPLTVTHPEMRRYFMTIPEAVQLVLQAATMGQGGEIFVLDMGTPVKIVDLAKKLVLLSGLRTEIDIKITFTGIRPGEKLYEEISLEDENMRATYHEKIWIFGGPTLSLETLAPELEKIRGLCRSRSAGQLLMNINRLVPEYQPSAGVLMRCMPSSGSAVDTERLSDVIAPAQMIPSEEPSF